MSNVLKMSDTLTINIKIDSRFYPLVVNRRDEERYRNAAKKLNEVVSGFRNNYPDKDMQDIMAMAAFQFSYSTTVQQENIENEVLINELKNLNDDLTDFLDNSLVHRQ